MKIAYCSDLHLEFGDITIENDKKYDAIILAGDILVAEYLYRYPEDTVYMNPEHAKCVFQAEKFRKFIKDVSEKFPKVFVIAGNHEFYKGKFGKTIDILRMEYSKYPNITFMEKNYEIYNGVLFIGGTLWTDMNNKDPVTLYTIQQMLNDYKYIVNDERGYTPLRPIHTFERHLATRHYISNILMNHSTLPAVVISHHAPSKMSTHPRYMDDYEMNGGYSSNMDEFILNNPNIKFWVHGHTHEQFDYLIGDTNVLANPRGYHPFEERSQYFKLEHFEVK